MRFKHKNNKLNFPPYWIWLNKMVKYNNSYGDIVPRRD